MKKNPSVYFGLVIGLLLAFAGLAKAGHDLWAATLIYIVVLGLFSVLWVDRSWAKGSPGIFVQNWVPALVLLGILTLSFRSSINPSESWLELSDWTASLLVFFIALNIFRQDKNLNLLIRVVIPFFWVQALVPFIFLSSEFWMEAPGTLINANVMTGFLLFWVPILSHDLLTEYKKKKKVKWYELTGLVAALVSLVLGGSISAWLLLVLFSPLFIGYEKVSKWIKKNKSLFWISLVGFSVVAFGVVLTKFSGIIENDTTRNQFEKIGWWLTGLEMLKDHPILGIGLGNFQSAFLAYRVGEGAHTLFPHSSLIGLLSETGIAGALSVFTFLGFGFSFLIRNKKSTLNRWPWLLGLILFLLFSLVNIGIDYLLILMTVFLFLGILMSAGKMKPWKPPRIATFLVFTLVFSALPFVISPFMASQNVVYAHQQQTAGNLNEALENYQSASELDPRAWEPFQGWAAASFLRFREKGAEADLRNAITLQQRAIDLNKLNARLYWEMGSYLWWAERKPEAMQFFEAAVRFHKTNKHYKEALQKLN